MINIDPTILIMMGEVILVLIVAMAVSLLFMFKGKKRDRAAVAELQGRLKENASTRQEWFENVLANSIENGDEQANRELATHWVEKENQFYAHLVNMYMKRNSSALRGLDKLLHEYTSSYLDLVALMRTRIDEEQESVPDDVKTQLERLAEEGERLSAIVNTLEQENQRLNSELAAANQEIDQAMREYSLAFRPGSGMTGSAIPAAAAAAPVVMAAADSDEVVMEVAEELPADMPEEVGFVEAIEEPEVVEEMNLAELDQIPESEMEEVTEVADVDWRSSFDESPDSDLAAVEDVGAAKGAVIDLADEGELLLPELNEIMAADEQLEFAGDLVGDDAMVGDLLPDDDQIPVLEESVATDIGGMIDEENLLAQLEGLEEIELPSFSEDLVMDESTDLTAGKKPIGKS
jgi:hypothetical protein